MKLQLVRNFAGKIVVGLKKFDNISQCLKSLRWLCIEDKWLLNTTAVVHKCLSHHQVRDYLNDKLLYRLQIMIRQSAIISGFLISGQRTCFPGSKTFKPDFPSIEELLLHQRLLRENYLNCFEIDSELQF